MRLLSPTISGVRCSGARQSDERFQVLATREAYLQLVTKSEQLERQKLMLPGLKYGHTPLHRAEICRTSGKPQGTLCSLNINTY